MVTCITTCTATCMPHANHMNSAIRRGRGAAKLQPHARLQEPETTWLDTSASTRKVTCTAKRGEASITTRTAARNQGYDHRRTQVRATTTCTTTNITTCNSTAARKATRIRAGGSCVTAPPTDASPPFRAEARTGLGVGWRVGEAGRLEGGRCHRAEL